MLIEKAGISVHRFVWDYLDTNSYVAEEGKELLIIDPIDTDEFWNFMDSRENCTVSVILTHEHFDHINGLNKLRERYPCTVYAQAICSENIGIVGRNLSNIAEVVAYFKGISIPDGKKFPLYKSDPADVEFKESLKFTWQGHAVEIFHTPGHSVGSVCIVLDGKLLFSGDTLMDTPTATKLPGGSTKQYEEITVPKLNTLKGKIEYVFPGHGEGGTMEDLLKKSQE